MKNPSSVFFLYKGAIISKCELYRYELHRFWSDEMALMWIMLNPSTADHLQDDPTIRRCISLSRREGAGGIVVCNLFALRSPNPTALLKAEDPIGPENDSYILEFAKSSNKIICAWGANGGLLKRNQAVMKLLKDEESKLYCLGTTKQGHPRHPLYLKCDTELVRYKPEEK